MRSRLLISLVAVIAAVAAGSSPATGAGQASPTAGVVIVETRLAYGGGTGAATGVVLTSSGTVLTNNHVIRGAGSIRVTVPSTGRTYNATVAGYSVVKDVALLELQDATGLQTVRTGNSNTVRVGHRVRAVGNAGGEGLTIKSGRVTGLGQSITVNDASSPLKLVGLIETTAPLRFGDSGGPLLSNGRVIGISAAASGGAFFRGAGQGYAIPINRALQIAEQIEAGRRSASVHVGPTAFLGVSVEQVGGGEPSGALVRGVASGSPAARAGIGVNDVIVAFAGKRVSSPAALRGIILRMSPGQNVRLAWIDPSAGRTSATVRLVEGPPQ
jgi:S1-C subfamily serine protease